MKRPRCQLLHKCFWISNGQISGPQCTCLVNPNLVFLPDYLLSCRLHHLPKLSLKLDSNCRSDLGQGSEEWIRYFEETSANRRRTMFQGCRQNLCRCRWCIGLEPFLVVLVFEVMTFRRCRCRQAALEDVSVHWPRCRQRCWTAWSGKKTKTN